MLNNRLELRDKLEALAPGVSKYYQPPENIKMEYPCFVYSPTSGVTLGADDRPYVFLPTYDVTIISKNPEEPLVYVLANNLVGCRMDTPWVVDNLHHTNFVVS